MKSERLTDKFCERFSPLKIAIMCVGIFFMGFFLSFLIEVDMGTDPFSFMNLMIARKIGIDFGTEEMVFNFLIFIPLLIWGRRLIGPGTIMNMICIGYIADFFRFVWSKCIPREYFEVFPMRAVIFAVTIVGFVIAAAIYMNADAGMSPYDGLAKIISDAIPKVPFFITRIVYDGTAVVIGCLLGGKLNPGLVSMVVLLGPAVSLVGKMFNKIASAKGKKNEA